MTEDQIKQLIREYIIDNVSLSINEVSVWPSDGHSYRISISVDGEEVSAEYLSI